MYKREDLDKAIDLITIEHKSVEESHEITKVSKTVICRILDFMGYFVEVEGFKQRKLKHDAVRYELALKMAKAGKQFNEIEEATGIGYTVLAKWLKRINSSKKHLKDSYLTDEIAKLKLNGYPYISKVARMLNLHRDTVRKHWDKIDGNYFK